MSERQHNTIRSQDDTVSLPDNFMLGANIRAFCILIIFSLLTLPLMPVQFAFLKLSLPYARTFPHWYHRCVCRLLGIRLHINGQIAHDRPVLIVANHISWLDIPILSAVAPVSFIAKSEVDSWPFISLLAKLQRTVFVNRTRKTDVVRVADTMAKRLASGDFLVLFAEGTSTDGNRVLPFRSALLSPAFAPASADSPKAADTEPAQPVVQTLSLAYTHLHGIPLGREDRKIAAWYGDMDMLSHAWTLLKAGPLDVGIVLGDPIALSTYRNRKDLAQSAEQQVRQNVMRLLRGDNEGLS